MVDLEHELGDLLNSNQLTLSTAESCTGGLIAHRITNVSGSSKYFECGVISYSNSSKMDMLKVSEKTLEIFGAVSAEVAKAMAMGIRNVGNSDLGLAVTGIAGPTGGTINKPVGLVYIALSNEKKIIVKEFQFNGSRGEIKHQTSEAALEIVIEYLKNL